MPRALSGHKWFYYLRRDGPTDWSCVAAGSTEWGGAGAGPGRRRRAAGAAGREVRAGGREPGRPHRCRFRMLCSSWEMALKPGRSAGS